MQYVFFEKVRVRSVKWGLGPLPQKLGNSREFLW